jgi:antitoxin HicB
MSRKTTTNRQTIKELMSRHYSIALEQIPHEEGGGYVARIPDLPGITGCYGNTPKDALDDLNAIKKSYFEAAIASGYRVPDPIEAFSGQIKVKLPKTLHRDLAKQAQREGVSLNTLIIARLSVQPETP